MAKKPAAMIQEKIAISPAEISRIAANALNTLAYRNNMHDKHDNKIIYLAAAETTYLSERWRCLYQAIVTWEEAEDGVELTIKVSEQNYGADQIDECVVRAKDIWAEICKIAERSKSLKPKEMPYKAKFASLEDLKSEGYIIEPDEDRPLQASAIAKNFLVGLFQGTKLRLPERMTQRHVLVCGPTGSGKSMSVFIPNLIERVGTSAIVTEAVSGNKPPVLYSNTAGWRAKQGQKVIYFNPSDMTSCRINPVDQVKSFDDAQHLAHLIVTNTTAESHVGDQVWSQSETHLLQALLLHVAGFRKDLYKPSEVGDNANLGYIRRLLRRGPGGMEDELKETRLPIARKEYMAYLNCTSPNFRYGVVSGLMMRLNLFVNPRVSALTEVTDFSIDELKSKLFTIYLATSVHRAEYMPLAGMIFNFCLSIVLQDLDKFKHPLTILADEFTNFGYLPEMPRYLTVIRNAGIGVALGIQDPVQLERVYREKDARILFGQPRTKIFFAPADDLVALRLSKLLGTTTQRESVAASGQLSDREIPRPLLDVSELMQLEKESKYICLTATETLKLQPIKPWEAYKAAISYKPPERPQIVVDENPEHENPEGDSPPPWIKGGAMPELEHNAQVNVSQELESMPANHEESNGDGSYWDRLASMAAVAKRDQNSKSTA